MGEGGKPLRSSSLSLKIFGVRVFGLLVVDVEEILILHPRQASHAPSSQFGCAAAWHGGTPSTPDQLHQTHTEHHTVTNDWLSQAITASDRMQRVGQSKLPEDDVGTDGDSSFSVIEEFNYWWKKPDLDEAIVVIMALAIVIRSSKATMMMELKIELKKASDSLKVDGDVAVKSLFWLLLHDLCCIISLILGFHFFGLIFYRLFSASATTISPATTTNSYIQPLTNIWTVLSAPARIKVVVGRHGIRIRPFPHLNPKKVMRVHTLIDQVWAEQRRIYDVKDQRWVVVITPTYARTFQTVYLTGLMHTLMLVPSDLVWIIVEADGASNETASLLCSSRLTVVHVSFEERMPLAWDDRHRLEARMRLHMA